MNNSAKLHNWSNISLISFQQYKLILSNNGFKDLIGTSNRLSINGFIVFREIQLVVITKAQVSDIGYSKGSKGYRLELRNGRKRSRKICGNYGKTWLDRPE